jgi:hypothetical protein
VGQVGAGHGLSHMPTQQASLCVLLASHGCGEGQVGVSLPGRQRRSRQLARAFLAQKIYLLLQLDLL